MSALDEFLQVRRHRPRSTGDRWPSAPPFACPDRHRCAILSGGATAPDLDSTSHGLAWQHVSAMAAAVDTTTAAALKERERVLRVLRGHERELRARPDPPGSVRFHGARRPRPRERCRSTDRGRCRAPVRPVRFHGSQEPSGGPARASGRPCRTRCVRALARPCSRIRSRYSDGGAARSAARPRGDPNTADPFSPRMGVGRSGQKTCSRRQHVRRGRPRRRGPEGRCRPAHALARLGGSGRRDHAAGAACWRAHIWA
jgi:hypothetical protein